MTASLATASGASPPRGLLLRPIDDGERHDPDPSPKSISPEGIGAEVMNQSVLVFDRCGEEVSCWSVYSLGKGQHFFDTHVLTIEFTISREFDMPRFVGFETPSDDTANKRTPWPGSAEPAAHIW